MLVIGRDERHVAAARDLSRHVDARQQWHVNIEKRHIGLMRLDRVQRGHPVRYPRHDFELWPQCLQQVRQLIGQQSLVFGEDRGGSGLGRRIKRAHRGPSRRH